MITRTPSNRLITQDERDQIGQDLAEAYFLSLDELETRNENDMNSARRDVDSMAAGDRLPFFRRFTLWQFWEGSSDPRELSPLALSWLATQWVSDSDACGADLLTDAALMIHGCIREGDPQRAIDAMLLMLREYVKPLFILHALNCSPFAALPEDALDQAVRQIEGLGPLSLPSSARFGDFLFDEFLPTVFRVTVRDWREQMEEAKRQAASAARTRRDDDGDRGGLSL